MTLTRSQRWATMTGGPAAEVDDATLVARAQTDGRHFALLYDRYVDPVYRFCYRRLGDEAAAEDATSLVFTRALTALPGFEPGGGSFRSWLFAIAHNAISDSVRSASHRLSQPLETALDVVDPMPLPEDVALAAERRRSVGDALALLPPDQRRIIELRLSGLNGVEIAGVIGRSHDAVRTAQRRAILRLQSLLNVPTDEENRDD